MIGVSYGRIILQHLCVILQSDWLVYRCQFTVQRLQPGPPKAFQPITNRALNNRFLHKIRTHSEKSTDKFNSISKSWNISWKYFTLIAHDGQWSINWLIVQLVNNEHINLATFQHKIYFILSTIIIAYGNRMHNKSNTTKTVEKAWLNKTSWMTQSKYYSHYSGL